MFFEKIKLKNSRNKMVKSEKDLDTSNTCQTNDDTENV